MRSPALVGGQLSVETCLAAAGRFRPKAAICFPGIGERTFQQQRCRASGLNLVAAAVVLWNTVYLERATKALREYGKLADDGMLQFLSPLEWEQINLIGDYV